MRRVLLLIVAIVFAAPAVAAGLSDPGGDSAVVGLRLMKEYRENPDPHSVPVLIKGLSERQMFKEPETSGVYVGFLAGVLGANPKIAKKLLAECLPLPFQDQWVLFRAVAYSRLPNWQELIRHLAKTLPERQTMADYYLTGKLPTLDDVQMEPSKPSASVMSKVRKAFQYETYFGKKDKKNERPRELTFATHPELIDTHWGIYFATGKEAALVRIVHLLPWSAERDDVDKLTIGNMAKFTLAANAAYDVKLLKALKRLQPELAEKVRPPLAEVIEAAETADTGRIRKEALAAVDELRKKGPGSKRDIATWGQVGQTVISMGCLGAAVAGQVQFGIPCVVGGAVSSATIRYLASPE